MTAHTGIYLWEYLCSLNCVQIVFLVNSEIFAEI